MQKYSQFPRVLARQTHKADSQVMDSYTFEKIPVGARGSIESIK